ncbi:MAG: hypothetical protein GQ522_05045 [Deltaproteobacteria bacterium]|nr:hypothetical protein [Deltaproteobacteria bacterium]
MKQKMGAALNSFPPIRRPLQPDTLPAAVPSGRNPSGITVQGLLRWFVRTLRMGLTWSYVSSRNTHITT